MGKLIRFLIQEPGVSEIGRLTAVLLRVKNKKHKTKQQNTTKKRQEWFTQLAWS